MGRVRWRFVMIWFELLELAQDKVNVSMCGFCLCERNPGNGEIKSGMNSWFKKADQEIQSVKIKIYYLGKQNIDDIYTSHFLILSRRQDVVSSETEKVWGRFEFEKNGDFEQPRKGWDILSRWIPLRTRKGQAAGKCWMSLMCQQTCMILDCMEHLS